MIEAGLRGGDDGTEELSVGMMLAMLAAWLLVWRFGVGASGNAWLGTKFEYCERGGSAEDERSKVIGSSSSIAEICLRSRERSQWGAPEGRTLRISI